MRKLVSFSGQDVLKFLHGLCTNDINALQPASAMYTHFLNAQGRVVFDSFTARDHNADTFFLECDSAVLQQFVRHFSLFKMRQKVAIRDLSSSHEIWALLGSAEQLEPALEEAKKDPHNVALFRDTRTPSMGWRFYRRSTDPWKPSVPVTESDAYTLYRTLRGVPEGAEISGTIPLEDNIELMNGVSFDKGCYLGQELTARTYHTGVIRKRVVPGLLFPENDATFKAVSQSVQQELDAGALFPPSLAECGDIPAVAAGTDLMHVERKAGKVIASHGNAALLLSKTELLRVPSDTTLHVPLQDTALLASMWRPQWWPQDVKLVP